MPAPIWRLPVLLMRTERRCLTWPLVNATSHQAWMSPADIMAGHEKADLQGRHGDKHPPVTNLEPCYNFDWHVQGRTALNGRDTQQPRIWGWEACFMSGASVFSANKSAEITHSNWRHYPNHQTILWAHEKSLSKAEQAQAPYKQRTWREWQREYS